jgi:hypothetical protein
VLESGQSWQSQMARKCSVCFHPIEKKTSRRHSPPEPITQLLGAEGKQDVAGYGGIAGNDEDHAVGDDRTADIERSAFGSNAVHGVKRVRRIEIPNNFAVFGGVGAEMPVDGAGENEAERMD